MRTRHFSLTVTAWSLVVSVAMATVAPVFASDSASTPELRLLERAFALSATPSQLQSQTQSALAAYFADPEYHPDLAVSRLKNAARIMHISSRAFNAALDSSVREGQEASKDRAALGAHLYTALSSLRIRTGEQFNSSAACSAANAVATVGYYGAIAAFIAAVALNGTSNEHYAFGGAILLGAAAVTGALAEGTLNCSSF